VDLDLIDAELGGPMVVRLGIELLTLPPAADLPWKAVVAVITNPAAFLMAVWPRGVDIPHWKVGPLQQAWIRHNGLPDEHQARRLVYMMQKYYNGIEYDLRDRLGLSVGDLWRERRWRELLTYIDHLPSNTHMNRLLTSDEEHMEAILRGQKKGTPGSGRPSMSDWGQLETMMATLIDAVNRNTAMQQAIANPKGAKPRIEPYPRPYSAADKIRNKIQKQEHESMVNLLLRDRPASAV
jgi:hypothetical protein